MQLREDPTWLGSIDWCVFSGYDFPCLGEYESDEKHLRKRGSVRLETLRLFRDFEEKDAATEDIVAEIITLTSAHAEGAVKALDHNALD